MMTGGGFSRSALAVALLFGARFGSRVVEVTVAVAESELWFGVEQAGRTESVNVSEAFTSSDASVHAI
jgi:hypothetical protein